MTEPAAHAAMGAAAPHGAGAADVATDDMAVALAAAREDGRAAAHPMRWLRIEALARRAEIHQGATRRLLDARLAALLADLPPAAVSADAAAPAPTPARPLRELVAALGPAAPTAPLGLNTTESTAATPWPAPSAHPPELRAVRQHRATWTRLRAEQRVVQTQAALPGQAGPLNSQLLLHRALTTMRETAPAYLQHFMGQVEALMWMEQAQASAPAEAPKSPKAAAARGKTAKAPARSRGAKPPTRAR